MHVLFIGTIFNMVTIMSDLLIKNIVIFNIFKMLSCMTLTIIRTNYIVSPNHGYQTFCLKAIVRCNSRLMSEDFRCLFLVLLTNKVVKYRYVAAKSRPYED